MTTTNGATMDLDLTVREHMTAERSSVGYKIVRAIQNCWDQNSRRRPGMPDNNQRIEANIQAVMDEFDLTLGEWHYWCKQARG